MPGQPSLIASAARSCQHSAVSLVEASRNAKAFPDECVKLAKYAKRIQSVLEDLEQGSYSAAAEDGGAKALRVS